jgi:hypothetical protein
MAKKKPIPPKKQKLDHVMAVRTTVSEFALFREAAAPYPTATWARVELVRLAEEKLGRGRGK